MEFIKWWKSKSVGLKAAILYMIVIFIVGIIMIPIGGELSSLGILIVVTYLLVALAASLTAIGIEIVRWFYDTF